MIERVENDAFTNSFAVVDAQTFILDDKTIRPWRQSLPYRLTMLKPMTMRMRRGSRSTIGNHREAPPYQSAIRIECRLMSSWRKNADAYDLLIFFRFSIIPFMAELLGFEQLVN